MIDFESRCPLSALSYEIEDRDGGVFDVIVARGTFDLVLLPDDQRTDGLTHGLHFQEDQPPLAVTDAYFGEMNKSSVRHESDLAQQKPRCDVIVIGAAHSPSREAVPTIEVQVSIERTEALPEIEETGTLLSQRLLVHGARAFVRGRARDGERLTGPTEEGYRLTEPEPFTRLDIRYEHAFGGELRVRHGDLAAEKIGSDHRLSDEVRAKHPDGERAPIAHTICAHNPVGTGFLERWYEDALSVDRWPAPRIEAPGHEITVAAWRALVRGDKKPGDDPSLSPQGLGVVAKPWSPRRELAGTFDAHWLENKWPRMPDDFDMAYWNGAHVRMQSPYLFGEERVSLWNLAAPGTAPIEDGRSVVRFQVPEINVAARLLARDGRTAWGGLVIDTLVVDMEERTVAVVWRILLPADLRIAEAGLLCGPLKGRVA